MKLEKITARGAEGLYREQSTKIIYFRQFKKGRGEIKRSTRTTSLDEAKKFRDNLSPDTKSKSKVRASALELFDSWIAEKETLGKAPGTLTSLKASRKHLEPFFASMMPEDITDTWWAGEYIPSVRASAGSARKFFNDKKWVTSFTKDLHSRGLIKTRPALKNPDPPRAVGKVFSDEEIATLIGFAQNEDLKLAIQMAATMGMRRGEIFALQCDRVDIESSTINLRAEDTKTRKPRSFKISEVCLPAIVFRAQNGSPWIFPAKLDPSKPLHKDGYMTAWRNLKRMTAVEGRFHFLRHTFLTKAFKAAGANPALICNYAGLSLEVAEKVYLHLTADDTKAVSALVTYE